LKDYNKFVYISNQGLEGHKEDSEKVFIFLINSKGIAL